MKLLNQCAACAIVLSLLAACADETPWGYNSGEGYVKLNVDAFSDVEAAVPAVRAVTADVVTPDVSKFSISMVKEGGGYSKTWTSIEAFSKEESFPVGTYTLTASYGDEKSQGRVLASEIGYEHAYYKGETEVVIKDGETTNVRLSVSLQNSIVVIEYTDAFKKYFTSYETILQAAGYESINLGNNEAMNYVQPGDVDVTISATLQNGKKLTLNPATYEIEAKHMYKLRYNIYNGEVGNTELWIEFDENLTEDKVVVNLSDQLDIIRAPQVSTVGFNSGGSLASDPTSPYEGDAKLTVVADGGIKSAKLTVISEDYKPSYVNENGIIDLCSADAAQQAAMEADGIKVIGLFNKNEYQSPDVMGEIDFSGLFQNFEGSCEFSFQVTDDYTQTHEPVSFTMVSVPVKMSADNESGLQFGENYTDIIVGYNGLAPDLTSPFTFVVKDSQGENVACDVESVEATTRTRSSADYPIYYYKYSIKVPDIEEVTERDEFNVNVLFNGVEDSSMEVPVKTIYPAHTMTYDAMATQLRWRVDFPGLANKEDADDLLAKYMNRLRVFVGGTAKTSTYDSDIDAYVISGLTAAQTYSVKTSMHVNQTAETETSITMETAADVPNGDFSSTQETINYSKLQVGGQWKAFGTYTTTCDMIYSEPIGGWASINSKTFCTDSNTKNTWFMVASTYMDGSNVIIRSVAYDHNGTVPATSGQTLSVTSYCTNYPSSIANRSAGELFLGSYSYSYNSTTNVGSESRSDGYDFTSRPSKLVFTYSYTPYKTDEGIVEMKILDSDGTELGSATENLPESSTKEFTLSMPKYAKFGIKPAKLIIKFLSSTQNPVLTKEDSEIDLSLDSKAAGGNLSEANSAHAFSSGSELTISNLRFEY